jgi:uncharacterized glyoxalase superfamily protein PhnB
VVRGVVNLIDFLKQAFDAQETERVPRPDGTIMHAQVRIGDSFVILSDPIDGFEPIPGSLYLYVPDTDAVYQRSLLAGGTSLMEPADQFFGDRNAGVQDPAGNQWWIATHKEDVSPAEIAKRAETLMKTQHAAG